MENPGFFFDFQLIDVPDFNGVGESEPNPYFYQVRPPGFPVLHPYLSSLLSRGLHPPGAAFPACNGTPPRYYGHLVITALFSSRRAKHPAILLSENPVNPTAPLIRPDSHAPTKAVAMGSTGLPTGLWRHACFRCLFVNVHRQPRKLFSNLLHFFFHSNVFPIQCRRSLEHTCLTLWGRLRKD